MLTPLSACDDVFSGDVKQGAEAHATGVWKCLAVKQQQQLKNLPAHTLANHLALRATNSPSVSKPLLCMPAAVRSSSTNGRRAVRTDDTDIEPEAVVVGNGATTPGPSANPASIAAQQREHRGKAVTLSAGGSGTRNSKTRKRSLIMPMAMSPTPVHKRSRRRYVI